MKSEMARWEVSLLLLFISVCFPRVHSNQTVTNETLLYQHLLDNYIPVRPGAWNTPLSVNVVFNLYQIINLDGKGQILSTVGQLLINWVDASFAWNMTAFGGIPVMTFSAEDIWTPLIGIRNSVGNVVDPSFKTLFPARALANGTMLWAPTGPMHTSCDLNMFTFPFDTQECSIDIGSLMDPNWTLVLRSRRSDIDSHFYMESKEFALLESHVEIKSLPIVEIGGYLSVASFGMKLQRKHSYYMLTILIPIFVLAILSAFTFLVPIDAGEKLSLSITILLSFSVFMLLLSDMTPQTSNMPILAIYLTATICISAGSMVCTIITQNIYHKSPVTPLPACLKVVALGCLGRVLLRQSDWATWQTQEAQDKKVDKVPVVTTPKVNEDGISNCSDVTEAIRLPFSGDLFGEVQKLTSKMAEDDDEERLRSDWRLAATVVDRFFFLLFLLVQVTMCLIPTVIVPNIN